MSEAISYAVEDSTITLEIDEIDTIAKKNDSITDNTSLLNFILKSPLTKTLASSKMMYDITIKYNGQSSEDFFHYFVRCTILHVFYILKKTIIFKGGK